MDRRTVIAVVLSLAIWYSFMMVQQYFFPAPPEPEGALVEGGASEPSPVAPAPAAVAAAPAATIRTVPFHACGATGELSTDGRLHGVTLDEHTGPYHVMPLYSWVWGRITGSVSGPWRPYGGAEEVGPAEVLSPKAAGLVAGTGSLTFTGMELTELDGGYSLVGTRPDGVEVAQRLVPKPGDTCSFDWSVTFTNRGAAPATNERWVALLDHAFTTESRYDQPRQPTALVDGSVYYGGLTGTGWCGMSNGTQLGEDQPAVPIEGPVAWFGASDRYFGSYVVPRDAESKGQLRFQRVGEGDEALDGAVLVYSDPLQPGASEAHTYQVYLGPNHEPSLRAVDPTLTRAIDLGWTAFFGTPLVMALRLFHDYVGNWGLSIILLTLVLKTLFFPLTQSSFRSMQRMQQVQPELNDIREKYKDDPAEQQRLTLEVMTKHKVNPVAGCLPPLAQMPVWFALYQVLLTSVDLYHTEFLYLKDLTAPDPYMILPILITVTMTVQQALTPMTNVDPAQQQVMRFIPLMFGLMFFAFPSGLAVYNLVNMLLTILQQWLVRRTTRPLTPIPAAAG